MRPGRPLLLSAWPGLAEALEERGLSPVGAAPDPAAGPPYAASYVAAASLAAAAQAPPAPLIIAVGEAAPLAAAVGAAQRAARRPPSGYVIADGLMPQPGTPSRADLRRAQNPDLASDHDEPAQAPSGYDTEPLPPTQDWPDAPCGYLYTDTRHAPCARKAALRGWPVKDASGTVTPADLAGALLSLIEEM
ncbi:hypothetical protein O4J56_21395 [Nocardiopsis sp. RSe5-2]|uniref:Uncharacterized protein n=1 Tax=Nocardiopsis endophytica TaxID=3018445 RepID=A0ABT4UA02_9ACTN|nr:hypothetical protein [Nocardiopsis endophytica]MDA2813215.1 hypothetical protein [Nocardiopsis endophytica]